MKDIKKIQEFFSKPLNENEVKEMTFGAYLDDLDNRFVDLMKAAKGLNAEGSQEIDMRATINQNFTLFRNYISALKKEYSNELNKELTFSINETKDIKAVNELAEELSPKDFPANFIYGDTIYVFNKIAKDRAVYYNPTMDGDIVVFGSREEMDSFLDDYTSPRGGTQSTNLGEDLNDPVLMKMRAAQASKAKKKADFGKEYGDAVKIAYGNDKNAKKLAFLKKERAQLMRDMEQEAEPEGGPIADEYGRKLDKIDAAIAKLEGRKSLTYDQAVGKVNEYDAYMPSQEEVDKFFALTQNEMHYLASKPVMGQEGTFNLMPIEPWDEYDYSNWMALVRKAKQQGKSIAEAKVDYDFSERELIRVLRQLKRGASTEIDMIKAFTKALGRDITKDELFSEAIAENDDKIKDLLQQLDFHTQMDNKGRASIIKDKIEKLRKLSNSGEIDGDEFLDKFKPLQKQLKAIDENEYKPKNESIAQTLAETIKLGEGVIEEELCPKGKAYIKRRKAAGEKSSAYLSGRAVKVCKGQMSGKIKEGISRLNEPEVITTLRKIVKNKQNDLIKDTKSGKKVRVDMNSANLMVQVYDALKKQSNKDKFVKSGIVSMGHMAYKLMKK